MKKRLVYFCLLLIFVFIGSFSYFSYAFFTSVNEENGKLNIIAGTLDYKFESDSLVDNKITVTANSYKNLTVDIESLNDIDSKYQIFYNFITDLTDDEKKHVYIECSYQSDYTSYQVIESGGSSKVKITIINGTNKDVEIEFGIKGGFTSQEISLNSNELMINPFNHLIDYSGNNYYGTFINGANIIYDEDEEMYAIDFDGTDDYVDIVDLPETIDWANGFTIEFEAKWDALNWWSRIFECNGIAVYNSSTRSTLTFIYDLGTTYSYVETSEIEMVNNRATYKVEMARTDVGYDLSIYQDDVVVGTKSLSTGYIENVTRSDAYLGKASDGKPYFDGKIYNLKITEADGDVILYYNPSQKYKITNLVANGSFENGLENWNTNDIIVGSLATDYANTGTNSIHVIDTANTTSSWIYNTFKRKIPAGHIEYSNAYVHSISVSRFASFTMAIKNDDGSYVSLDRSVNYTNESFDRISDYKLLTNSVSRVQVGIALAAIGESYYDDVMVFDLTYDFGKGNEPSKEWIDTSINWFESEKEIFKYDF